jgi:HSP20 family molecular chaperone IbpA
VKLELWKPFIDLEKEFDTVFRHRRSLIDKEEFAFRPSMDVERNNGELIVSTELPGIDPEKDVEITLEDDYLTIKGEKSEEKETSEDDRYLRERRYGMFVRRIPLPEGVSAEEISADYSKGVLTVSVTMPEELEPTEPRKIPVTIQTS